MMTKSQIRMLNPRTMNRTALGIGKVFWVMFRRGCGCRRSTAHPRPLWVISCWCHLILEAFLFDCLRLELIITCVLFVTLPARITEAEV
jgi:hypothetical protein